MTAGPSTSMKRPKGNSSITDAKNIAGPKQISVEETDDQQAL
jgi:hypothetical protein